MLPASVPIGSGGRSTERFETICPTVSIRAARTASIRTFCHAGGMFRYPIPFRLDGPVRRSYTVTLEDGAVKSYAYWFAALTAP